MNCRTQRRGALTQFSIVRYPQGSIDTNAFTGRDRLTMCYFPYFSGPKFQLRDTSDERRPQSFGTAVTQIYEHEGYICSRHPKYINVSALDIYASFSFLNPYLGDYVLSD